MNFATSKRAKYFIVFLGLPVPKTNHFAAEHQWLEDEMWARPFPICMVSWRGRSDSKKSMKIDPLETTLRGRTKKDRLYNQNILFLNSHSFVSNLKGICWVFFFSENTDSYKKHNGEKTPELH